MGYINNIYPPESMKQNPNRFAFLWLYNDYVENVQANLS